MRPLLSLGPCAFWAFALACCGHGDGASGDSLPTDASLDTCRASDLTVQCAGLTCAGATPICCSNDDFTKPLRPPPACSASPADCYSHAHVCDDRSDCPDGGVCCLYAPVTGGEYSVCSEECSVGEPAGPIVAA